METAQVIVSQEPKVKTMMTKKNNRVIKTTSTQAAASIFDAYEGNIKRVSYNRETGVWVFTVTREPKAWEM